MLPRVFFFLLCLGGCFEKQNTCVAAGYHGKNKKKKSEPYTYSITPLAMDFTFFFHCELALGSRLALNKFSFWLDKGWCIPQTHKTPPTPQFIEPYDRIIFPGIPMSKGLFYHKELNKNIIMVQ